jgi:hypothetical protein
VQPKRLIKEISTSRFVIIMSLPFDFYATAIDSTSKHLTVAAHLPGRLKP